MTGPENVGHAMGWSHEDSWEVCLVLRVLETLEGNSESVDPGTGEVRHSVSFTRECSIPKFHDAVGKRFDFSVMVDNGEFRREFLHPAVQLTCRWSDPTQAYLDSSPWISTPPPGLTPSLRARARLAVFG